MHIREVFFYLLMFTVGALTAGIHYERTIRELGADVECAYHTGEGDGYRSAMAEQRERAKRATLTATPF